MKIKLGMGACDMQSVKNFCAGEIYDFTGYLGSRFEYVCTDSREADENTMFVATRGERVDGHDYIASAIKSGCRCVLCEYVPSNIEGYAACFVVVEDSVAAFADVARGYRAGKHIGTVAITGSVGKTTTKELTSLILREKYNTYFTVGNFNSVIGMPMSLMEVGDDAEAAVFEMGMSGFGEISSMSLCARPDVAIVTNIGSSHLEYLKTRENIAKAKLEIADGLSSDGYLLLPDSEPLLKGNLVSKIKNKCKIVYVGIDNGENCDISANNIRIEGEKTLFELKFFDKKYENIEINAIGRHFAINAAMAASAALIVGCGEEEVRAGLRAYTPAAMRQNISVKNGLTVISDCYNAAPESMRASLDVLAGLSVSGKRIAVLGDMRELGEDSDKLHREIGAYAVRSGVNMLVTLGKSGALIAEAAISHGLSPTSVIAHLDVENIDGVIEEIRANIIEGDVILFKASRAIKLERIIEKLF